MKEITTSQLQQLIKKDTNFILLDCRGVDYYNWEHIPNALNLRWKYVAEKSSNILPDKQQLIVTYCDGFTCEASIRCYEALSKAGYQNLIEYSGGLSDWKANSRPTISEPTYKLAPNIYRFPNQKFYSETVGSYLIEEDKFILLIDGPQQLTEEHEDFILHFSKPIKILLSHHSTGGETSLLQKKYQAEIFLHKLDRKGDWLTVDPNHLIDTPFNFSHHLQLIHNPGHSPGSVCLLDTQNHFLFTGDHLSGTKNGQIHDFIAHPEHAGDTQMRLKSARKLLDYEFDAILPFHYQPILHSAKSSLEKFLQKYDHQN